MLRLKWVGFLLINRLWHCFCVGMRRRTGMVWQGVLIFGVPFPRTQMLFSYVCTRFAPRIFPCLFLVREVLSCFLPWIIFLLAGIVNLDVGEQLNTSARLFAVFEGQERLVNGDLTWHILGSEIWILRDLGLRIKQC